MNHRRPTNLGLIALLGAWVWGCAASSAEIAFHEGLKAHAQRKFSVAQTRYQRALSLQSDMIGAQTNLSAIALERGALEDALKHVQAELTRRPSDPTARLMRGSIMFALGNFEKTLADATPLAKAPEPSTPRTVSRETIRSGARLLVGLARWGHANLQPAPDATQRLEAARNVISLVADSPVNDVKGRKADIPNDGLRMLRQHAIRVAAILDIATQRYADGLKRLRALKLPGKAAPYPLIELHALIRLGRYQEVLDMVSSAAGGPYKSSPWASIYRGHALAATDNHAKIPRFVSTIAADDGHAPALRAAALRLLAAAASAANDWKKAQDHLSLAIEALRTTNVPHDLWLDHAVAQAQLGRIEPARRTVAGVLRDAPEHPRARRLETALSERTSR